MHDEFFGLLKKEHDVVKNLFNKILRSSSSDKREREELFDELRKAIIPHIRGEENAFYPILQDNRKTRSMTLVASEEHYIAKILLKDLSNIDTGDDLWAAKMQVLSGIINRHIEFEESIIFDAVRDTFDESKLGSVFQNYRDVEARSKAGVV